MIVKNESKIIERLLKSTLSVIDTYCICDTGSTDNTQEIIKSFFDKHNIKGKIVNEPFKNFCHNRNYALKACLGMSDYVLLLDADMILQNDGFNKNILKSAMGFCLVQKSGSLQYHNLRLVKNNGEFEYKGVTHEYLSSPEGATIKILDSLYIIDIGDGGSKTDKFERDIRLLTQGIKDEPNNSRYYFYLANSYFDLNRNNEAIKYYEKRIEKGGWDEEVWYSHYRIGLCYEREGDMIKAINSWLNAHEIIPSRLENMYKIIKYYREHGKNKLAQMFYFTAIKFLESDINNINNSLHLFLESDIYTWRLYNEYTIISYYNGNKNINDEIVHVLNNCSNKTHIKTLLSNMKFYQDVLIPITKKSFNTNNEIVLNNEKYNLISSTPCIIKDKTSECYLLNVRTVNYTINKQDPFEYFGVDKHIISGQILYKLNKNFDIINKNEFDIEYDKNRLYIGIEDVRIFPYKDEILFLGTTQNKNEQICMVKGKYDIINNKKLKYEELANIQGCEKNWVYFNDYDISDNLKVIYKWFPLTIGTINENNALEIKETRKMPLLFSNVRGSSCGYNYKNEIWFITHIVSYEKEKHYYHLIVVFDKSMRLLRYTAPFKFEGALIEYCLSIIVEDERVLIPYSTWDNTSNIGIYDKNYIEEKFYKNEK